MQEVDGCTKEILPDELLYLWMDSLRAIASPSALDWYP
jgi:hypothetical protein